MFRRKLRFENAWKVEPGFDDMVHTSWNMATGDSVLPRLNRCAEDMQV
jgi:hypothetical protein